MINFSFKKHFLDACYFLGLVPDAASREKESAFLPSEGPWWKGYRNGALQFCSDTEPVP